MKKQKKKQEIQANFWKKKYKQKAKKQESITQKQRKQRKQKAKKAEKKEEALSLCILVHVVIIFST